MAGERARQVTQQHDAFSLEVNLNTSGNFNDTNVNKKSLCLNVRSPRGLDIAKRLIAISDIVIENFSSRVLQKWGLGYAELCKVKPDIVYVSMSGYGHTGRQSRLHHVRPYRPGSLRADVHLRFAGQTAGRLGWSYMDDTGGLYGAMCALTGLYHRNMTGRGQHIDLAQMVSSVPLRRSGAPRLHGEWAGVAAGWLSAGQPCALARARRLSTITLGMASRALIARLRIALSTSPGLAEVWQGRATTSKRR